MPLVRAGKTWLDPVAWIVYSAVALFGLLLALEQLIPAKWEAGLKAGGHVVSAIKYILTPWWVLWRMSVPVRRLADAGLRRDLAVSSQAAAPFLWRQFRPHFLAAVLPPLLPVAASVFYFPLVVVAPIDLADADETFHVYSAAHMVTLCALAVGGVASLLIARCQKVSFLARASLFALVGVAAYAGPYLGLIQIIKFHLYNELLQVTVATVLVLFVCRWLVSTRPISSGKVTRDKLVWILMRASVIAFAVVASIGIIMLQWETDLSHLPFFITPIMIMFALLSLVLAYLSWRRAVKIYFSEL